MIALYELERPALKIFTEELKQTLLLNQVHELAELLELGDGLRDQLATADRLIDLFLLPEDDKRASPLWASLRRVSRKRAMTKVFTSTHANLEGRLRAYDVLRNDAAVAKSIDRLLNPKRLPWYLRRDGATCGWLGAEERDRLVTAMRKLEPSLTPELQEALDGLHQIDGDVVAHDAL
jgi:hypothetical protein